MLDLLYLARGDARVSGAIASQYSPPKIETRAGGFRLCAR